MADERRNVNGKQSDNIFRKVVFPVLGALFIYAVSGGISNKMCRWAFVLFAICAIVLFSAGYGQEDGRKRMMPGMFGVLAAAVLIGASIKEGKTMKDYAAEVDAFFGLDDKEGMQPPYDEEDRQEADMSQSEQEEGQLEQGVQELNENVQKLQSAMKEYGTYEEAVRELESSIAALSEQAGTDGLQESGENAKEQEEIREKIREYMEKGADDFPDLLTDKSQVEFFYKMLLCRDAWHYENIIAAMEDCGIDCRAMGIDVYTLVSWDTDELVALYNMRKSQEERLAEDAKGTFRLGYNEYRANFSSYIDTLDYGGYGYTFEDQSTSEAMKFLDGHIMKHYKKYIMNFRES